MYSADPALAAPGRFVGAAVADLPLATRSAWRIWRRGLQARHRQSRFGYAWLLAPPLAVALTWAYLDDAGLVRFGDVGIPYLAYVLTGALLWQVFADGLQAPLRELQRARPLLTKTHLPYETWVVAAAIDVLFKLLLRLAIIAVVLVAVGTPLTPALALVPFGIATLVVLGLALGVTLAPLGLLFEDFGHALALIAGFGLFLVPVVYAWPADVPGDVVVELNPVTPVLVTTRAWLADAPGAAPAQLVGVGLGATLLLVVAWFVMRLARPHLVSRL